MPGKSNTFKTDFLKLIFQAAAIPNVGDNASTLPLTNLYVALHTADPEETGNQSTRETSYTSYARATVPRSSSGWNVQNNTVQPVNQISFPECSGGTATITHFSVGTANAGTYSQSGTTITITLTGHGLTTGQNANLDFTSGTATDGVYAETVTNSSTFTVTSATSATTSGNVLVGGGATKILYFGAINPSIAIATGVTPRLTTSSTISEN